ncbi:MAG TPA: glycosyltransferase family 39 protein [Bryobacteraceae bacterium]
MKLVNRFGGLWDACARWMDARAPVCLLLCGWVYLVATCIRAQNRLFWYDELLTVNLCALPRFADVWTGVRAGIDLNPPLQYVAVRASQALFGAGHLGTRLPVVVSFLVMSLFVFLYLRRRVPAGWALAGMMLPWLTEAYRFALDARPYGILLGCSAAALYCWSRAAETDRGRGAALAGLTVSVSLALLTHCYAVLLAIPLAAGELARFHRSRRADWPVWTALALAALPVAIYPALASVSGPAVGRGSQFHVNLWTAPGAYRELLEPAFWPLLCLAMLIAAAVPGNDEKRGDSVPRHELAALAGFVSIPIFAVLLGAATTGSFSLRYGSPGVIGIACLIAWAGARGSRHAARAGAVAGVACFLFFAGGFVAEVQAALRASVAQAAAAPAATVPAAPRINVPAHSLLSLASANSLPVVIGSGLVFLEVEHYGGEALLRRTYYLVDRDVAMRRTASAGFEAALPLMKRMLHLRANVEPLNTFLEQRPQFLLYSRGYCWVLPELLDRDWRMRLLAKEGIDELAEVTAPDR